MSGALKASNPWNLACYFCNPATNVVLLPLFFIVGDFCIMVVMSRVHIDRLLLVLNHRFLQ